MKTSILFLFFLIILFCSCANNPITNNINSTTPEQVALSFLKWFKENSVNLIINNAIQPNPASTDKNYWVNKSVLKEGMEEIRNTNFFTENYLNNFERQFLEVEKILKVKPQNDGPAPGMNKLLFLNAQDVGDVWAGLEENKYIIENKVLRNDSSSFTILFVDSYPVKFNMIKKRDAWQIDEIK